MSGAFKKLPAHGPRTITYKRVVHLSRQIHPGIPLWPGDPNIEFETAAQLETDGYFLRRFSMGEHSGTHVNAPSSFFADGPGIDSYPAEALVAPASVIDVRERAAVGPDYALTLDDLESWEERHGAVPAGNIVLLHTRWQHRWSSPEDYLGQDATGRLHFPGFGPAAARRLLIDKGAAGLGTDTPGVEAATDTNYTVNKLALERRLIVLENLANLDQLPPSGATLVVGVLLLSGGTGSPASVLAFIP